MVDLSSAREAAHGCVAYGLALNAQSGNPDAAAKGLGDKEKIRKCEPIIGEPRGGGIPVP